MNVHPRTLRRALVSVVVTVFLDMLGFGIIVPILPLIVIDPANPYSLFSESVPLNIRYILLGVFIVLFPLAQLFSTPVLGDLSDSVGRKKVLLLSIAGTFISYILTAVGVMTAHFPLLLIARAIDGLSGGNLSVAQAVVADVSTPKTRSRNFAVLSASFGLGFILGPLLGARLIGPFFYSYVGLIAPFLATLVLSFVNMVVLILFMPETKKKVEEFSTVQLGKAVKHIRKAVSMPGIRLFFSVNFLLQGAFATLTAFLSVFLIARLGIKEEQFGFILSYLGVWMALGQILFVRAFTKKFGELKAFYVSLLGLSIAMLLLFIPRSLPLFLVVTPFVALFLGLSQVFILSLVSGSVKESQQGEVLGINSSVTALAQTIPPLIGGVGAAVFSPGTPILFAAAISFTATLLVRRRVKAMR